MQRRSRHCSAAALLIMWSSLLRCAHAAAAPPPDMDGAIRSMFRDCDADGDGKLNMPEMSGCIRKQAPPELADKIDPAYYFKKYDRNKNGYLNFDEFSEAVKPADNVEYDVTTRDGEKTTLTQQELAQKTLESTKGIRMEDGQLVKDDEGRKKLDDLIETNPAMARVVFIGEFARDLLNHSGAVAGRLHGLRTLPRNGEGAEESTAAVSEDFGEYLPSNKYFDIRLLLTFKDSKKLSKYEVVVERNPDLYPPPFMYITSAWRLNKGGKRSRRVDVPGLKESPVHTTALEELPGDISSRLKCVDPYFASIFIIGVTSIALGLYCR